MRTLLALIIAFFICLSGGLASARSVAAANDALAGFTVAPAQLSFRVAPDDSSQTAVVTITNTYRTPLHLVAELQTIDEDSLQLIPNGPLGDALSSVIKLSSTDITVPSNGTYALSVVVANSDQLSDGGQYASLVLTQRSDSGSASTFRPSVAVSMFIVKDQNIRTNLQLVSMHVSRTLFSLPSSATLTFKNLGNTHVIPRASVSVYSGQTLLSKATVNTASQIIFPDHQASFTASFATYSSLLWPHKLRLQAMYRIDGSDIELMKSQTFWYIPLVDIVAVLVVGSVIWWQHRRFQRYLAWVWSTVQKQLRRRRPVPARTAKVSGSTKRILGRTVIRTHRVATLLAALPTAPKAIGSLPSSVARQIPVRHQIVVTVSEDTPMVSPKTDLPSTPAKAPTSLTAKRSPSSKTSPTRSRKTAKKVSPSPRAKKPAKSAAKKPVPRAAVRPKKSAAKTNAQK